MSASSVVDTLRALARVPSAVPLGPNTLIAPDDPILVEYVQRHLRPLLASAASPDQQVIDLPGNHVAVRHGTGEGPCLALMAYTPTQHHNLMGDPWSGRLTTAPGDDAPAVYGQGVSQNKAHQACLSALQRQLADDDVELPGTLWLVFNNEGRSTHDCSEVILDHLPGPPPDLLVELFPTDFAVSVGNRGRIDLSVLVHGQPSHSSTPPASGRVIDGVAAVLEAVRRLDASVTQRRHPELGAEQAVVYQVTFFPEAPHTLPSRAQVVVDRRFVPPTTTAEAAEELASALAGVDATGCRVVVEPGVTMLPALFPDADLPVLRPLERAIETVLGRPAQRTVYGGAFDAGGPLARGIPTVMFGLPEEGDVLGDDYVRVTAVEQELAILGDTVRRFFGKGDHG